MPTIMNFLERSLIEKAAVENGWEYIVESSDAQVTLASARHKARVVIRPGISPIRWAVAVPTGLLRIELARSTQWIETPDGAFSALDIEQLALLLRRIAELALSLPDQAAATYAIKVQEELAAIQSFDTEVERMVKQRVGQDTFRQALLDYWGGACAVTGVDQPAVLRASHAKPWAVCGDDKERLNVFNGLLLTANLDALFDRGLITFDDEGVLRCSSLFTHGQLTSLQLMSDLRLRWIALEHQPFLAWHREKVFVV
jgi:hypothetical protein